MTERGRFGWITVKIDLPIEVAEHLARHGNDFLRKISRAIDDYHRSPPHDPSKGEPSIEDKLQERQVYLLRIGRSGYRALRQRIETFAYFDDQGNLQSRSGQSKLAWQRIIIRDLASDFGVSFDVLEFAISRFRKELKPKVKARRDKTIIRLYLSGYSNREIAEKVSVHSNTIARFLRTRREDIKTYAREHPETYNSLKYKENGKLPGKPREQAEIIDWSVIKRSGGQK